jgi:D-alanyl-D-alanine carboxypeptidase
MRIARNSLAERIPGEVKYYQAEFSPYSLDLLRMDSHGGWVGSAIDLANFIIRIDHGPRVKDILPSSRMAGTYLSYDNWWFSGSLSGTTSIVSRFSSDVNYVVLANTRTERDPNQIIDAIRKTVSGELEKIRDWP